MRILSHKTAWWTSRVFDLQAHNGCREEQKTRSKIWTLVRPWVTPALMCKATTNPCVRVSVGDGASDFERSFQLKSATLTRASQQTWKTLRAWCCKIQGSSLCCERLPGAFESHFNDERQHAWMLVFCLRSQGKNRQSQNNFRPLIFFLRCHNHLERSKSCCEYWPCGRF